MRTIRKQVAANSCIKFKSSSACHPQHLYPVTVRPPIFREGASSFKATLITDKQTVAMMHLMQMQGITYPTTTLANALMRLLESIYKEENHG